MLNEGYGWRTGLVGFVVLSLGCFRGLVRRARSTRSAPPRSPTRSPIPRPPWLRKSRSVTRRFVVMTLAYFVCGMQLVFINHASAVLSGDLRHGSDAERADARRHRRLQRARQPVLRWAGGRWNKLALLGGIYIFRSLALACTSCCRRRRHDTAFWRDHGILWLGVGPLSPALLPDLFGLQWQAMIQGLAFMSHQLGSFLGAYGGVCCTIRSAPTRWPGGSASRWVWPRNYPGAFALIRPTEPPLLRRMTTLA